MNTEFRMHKGARTSLYVVGALLVLLCITVPFALWVFFRVGRAKVVLSPDGVEAQGLVTDTVKFDDVARYGVLRVPLYARGVGGALANMRLDNMNEGINVVFQLKSGKTVKFMVNQYERHAELLEALGKAVRVPTEALTLGALGPKWPDAKP